MLKMLAKVISVNNFKIKYIINWFTNCNALCGLSYKGNAAQIFPDALATRRPVNMVFTARDSNTGKDSIPMGVNQPRGVLNILWPKHWQWQAQPA